MATLLKVRAEILFFQKRGFLYFILTEILAKPHQFPPSTQSSFPKPREYKGNVHNHHSLTPALFDL